MVLWKETACWKMVGCVRDGHVWGVYSSISDRFLCSTIQDELGMNKSTRFQTKNYTGVLKEDSKWDV